MTVWRVQQWDFNSGANMGEDYKKNTESIKVRQNREGQWKSRIENKKGCSILLHPKKIKKSS